MVTKEITKEEILETLKSVIDPEIGLNIVDLGLVYDVQISDKMILIIMTLTTPGCPMHGSIVDWVQRIVSMSFPNKLIDVQLVWEPRWTPDKMSEEAKRQLGI
ncbi:MAG: metal-sulfur cluster assembly factor [Ignavibacteria bacterium]